MFDELFAIVLLLSRFRKNPGRTRSDVRSELANEAAAEFFALVIFLCEGLMKIRRKVAIKKHLPNRARFLRIASQLPMELQMVLCYRLVDSGGVNIGGRQREEAFKHLAIIMDFCS
jgi:hypothetical protein